MKEKAGKYENLSQEMEQKIEKVIKDLENDFNFDYKNTPNKIEIKIKDGKGGIIKWFGITKGIEIPIENESYPIEKVLEASIRFPDDDHAESIKKLEELKESQEGG